MGRELEENHYNDGDLEEGFLEDAVATQTFSIQAPDQGKRIDQWLQVQFPDLSRGRLQKWITEGQVQIDGSPVSKSSQSLRVGQSVQVVVPEAQAAGEWLAEPMDLQIVFEDDDLLVLDKPAGLVVHPAAGHPSGTLLNGLLAHCPESLALPRAGIVHRLDRDTTGLMVVAKTDKAQLKLVRQLQDRTVSRNYLALVWGALTVGRLVDEAIGRDPRNRQKMAVVPKDRGKPAVTELRPLGQGSLFDQPVSLVHCRLQTGRTHQIRVHLQHLRHPILGDPSYDRFSPKASSGSLPQSGLMTRQALHAFSLSFDHPSTGKKLSFLADLPEDFKDMLTKAGLSTSLPSV